MPACKKRSDLDCPRAPTDATGDLVLLTIHGFGNRIRSLAAAWWLAAEQRRRLHMRWPADDSCGARFEELFETVLLTGDTLRTDSLVALSAAMHYSAGRFLHNDQSLISIYEGQSVDRPAELFTSDLLPLAADSARVVALRGATVPATLERKHAPPAASHRAPLSGAKAERIRMLEHHSDAPMRGAFYRALVPAAAVRAHMQTAVARIESERAAASADGRSLLLVGVHVRQGDALDLAQRYFFHDLTGGTHDADFVARFADEMAAVSSAGVAEGRRALFFLASDQEAARRILRSRFGCALVELAPPCLEGARRADETRGDPVAVVDEGRVGRGCHEMHHAVAEWLMLGRAEILIRSRKSSFSDEAALINGVRCIDLG